MYMYIFIYLFLLILVSMQTLAADVQHLRKGLDIAKSEREKQPDNYAIHVSISYCIILLFHTECVYLTIPDHLADTKPHPNQSLDFS